ncbi:MAG TPA: LL-diaminopimelate aminotransferase [Candidatus Saccharimonadales bacterium]|nr:LL-diaminopimelate aminotransferase [Candidatus Saccharimonadales bacterium]
MNLFRRAERLQQLPPYLFAEIDRLRDEARRKGVDVIDLGVGDPDLSTPAAVVERARGAVLRPDYHRYPPYAGLPALRAKIAEFYGRRFDVALDPEREVLVLIGSKEGLAHLPLALVNPLERVLVPNPGYPVYRAATLFAGGVPVDLPLEPENGFLPRAADVERACPAKLLFLNYPNNPTAAVADVEFYREMAALADRHRFWIASDLAYSEIGFEGYRAPSFLAAPGSRSVGIEFFSLSKTFNMTGWRVAAAVGNADLVAALAAVKSNLDSGTPQFVQDAAAAALELADGEHLAPLLEIYRERRDAVVEQLRVLGLAVEPPRATIYVWARVPAGHDSLTFARYLLEHAGVVVTPGTGFGSRGQGFFRISLTTPTDRLREAIRRLSELPAWTGSA